VQSTVEMLSAPERLKVSTDTGRLNRHSAGCVLAPTCTSAGSRRQQQSAILFKGHPFSYGLPNGTFSYSYPCASRRVGGHKASGSDYGDGAKPRRLSFPLILEGASHIRRAPRNDIIQIWSSDRGT
jgi:hypothetical protein